MPKETPSTIETVCDDDLDLFLSTQGFKYFRCFWCGGEFESNRDHTRDECTVLQVMSE